MSHLSISIRTYLLMISGCVLLASCSSRKENTTPPQQTEVPAEIPQLRTKSDSIAMNVLQAFGGHEAWASVRYLRFDFGLESEQTHTVLRKHLWNRTTGDERVEWTQGEDSTWVVLLNLGTKEGAAYLNGRPVAQAAQDSLVRRAYRLFINDSFWLVAPLRLLEQGVDRLYLPGWSDEQNDVITAVYASPDLAPDEQFWFWIDKDSSRLMRWAYVPNSRPEAGPIVYEWGEYESFETDAGTIRFVPRKKGPLNVVVTDNIALLEQVDDDAFSNPTPQL